MITGLDHIVVLVRDIGAAKAAYQTLLARAPAWQNSDEGADRVLFTLDNMTVELMAPAGDGDAAERIRAVIAAQGEGLASLCFRTHDIAKMHRRLDRLALLCPQNLPECANGRFSTNRPSLDLSPTVLKGCEPDGERGTDPVSSSTRTVAWASSPDRARKGVDDGTK